MWKPPTNQPPSGEKKPDAKKAGSRKPDPKKAGPKKVTSKPAVPQKPVLGELPKIEINKDKLIENGKRIGMKYAKQPLVWIALIAAIIYVIVEMPGWQRKSNFYELVNAGAAGYICLSHENGIFERSSMWKPYNTTKTYIRFDRETFITDFLKREVNSIPFIAVAVDMNGSVYWMESSLKENTKLSKRFKIELGTCLAAPNFHYNVPGAALVTNQ